MARGWDRLYMRGLTAAGLPVQRESVAAAQLKLLHFGKSVPSFCCLKALTKRSQKPLLIIFPTITVACRFRLFHLVSVLCLCRSFFSKRAEILSVGLCRLPGTAVMGPRGDSRGGRTCDGRPGRRRVWDGAALLLAPSLPSTAPAASVASPQTFPAVVQLAGKVGSSELVPPAEGRLGFESGSH